VTVSYPQRGAMANKMKRRWRVLVRPARTGAQLLMFLFAPVLLLGQTFQITTPLPGSLVYSGQTLTVTVDAGSTAYQNVTVLGPAQGSATKPALTGPPYRFSIPVAPDTTSGPQSIQVIGIPASGGDAVFSSITVDVERPDSHQSLKLNLGSLHFGFVGEELPEGVTGVFADGSLVDLDYSTYLTYVSDSPSVATADGRGMVTAVAPGFANVTISYNFPSPNSLSAQVPVGVPPPLTVLPPTSSLYASQTVELDAELRIDPNLDQSVTRSLSPGLGSIDKTGLYTAPSSVVSWQGVTVTAKSVANPAISASAKIWVFAPVPVALSPATATLTAGQALALTPTVVNGGNAENGPAVINWSISPSGVGAVQNSPTFNRNTPMPAPGGTYYAPGVITSPQTVTITATSGYDNTKAASAQVTLVPSVAVSISPPGSTLYVSRSQQFAAMVNYSSNATVTWSISPRVGTIDATGLYTAAANISYPQTVTITATGPNIGGGPNSASATVTLGRWRRPRSPSALAVAAASNSEIDLSWTAAVETGGSISLPSPSCGDLKPCAAKLRFSVRG
jgi:hypothetical protein